MREIMDEAQTPFPPEHGETTFQNSKESQAESTFRLIPFDPSDFPEGRMARVRADTVTSIKESLQDYTRLDGDAREFREESTRGDYIWSIIADLGMTANERPTAAYHEAFADLHEKAKDPKNNDIDLGELLDKYQDHPALGFIDSLDNVASKTTVTTKEIVMLRRSMLVLLDECGQEH